MLLGHGAQVNVADNRGHTPLHQVTLGNHDYRGLGMSQWDQKWHPGKVLRLAERLLESGADVNAQNKDQETPLHLASRLRLHAMARLLLKNGADVNAKNSEGKSPLHVATGRKGKAMRRLLSEYS
ncbi:Ankyrin repeat-containing domain protein, partial [Lactarius tabidus]